MASGSSNINYFPENQLNTSSALWTFWKHEHCSGLVTRITADTACGPKAQQQVFRLVRRNASCGDCVSLSDSFVSLRRYRIWCRSRK